MGAINGILMGVYAVVVTILFTKKIAKKKKIMQKLLVTSCL